MSSPLNSITAEAQAAAQQAAQRAGVRIRTVSTPQDAADASAVLNAIWNSDGTGSPPMETSLLIALEHGGNYVAVAYGGDQPVGVAAGFCGPPQAAMMHSHVAGVAAGAAGRGIGVALKLHQRLWCLERGITTMEWTYDPLIRRNAYFNLHRLGADVVEYLPHFYGEMTDGINAGQGSDRALVRWDLTEKVSATADEDVPQDVSLLLEVGLQEAPELVGSVEGALAGRSEHLWLRIPADIEQLRTVRPDLSVQWRTALRETMYPLMQAGWTISGIVPDGTYRLYRSGDST